MLDTLYHVISSVDTFACWDHTCILTWHLTPWLAECVVLCFDSEGHPCTLASISLQLTPWTTSEVFQSYLLDTTFSWFCRPSRFFWLFVFFAKLFCQTDSALLLALSSSFFIHPLLHALWATVISINPPKVIYQSCPTPSCELWQCVCSTFQPLTKYIHHKLPLTW